MVLLLLEGLLAIIELNDFSMSSATLLSMAMFGLTSFFSMLLFFYLVLSVIEFYPHTVRTLAVGVFFCFFQLGKLLFSVHIEWIEKDLGREEGMLELVLCCSVVLLLHSLLMQETFEYGGRYDLPEL
jgi:hypothetical protein